MELNLPIINFQTKGEITASNIDEIEAAATAFKAQADAFRPETYEDASQSDTIAKTAGKAEKLIGEAIDRAVSGDIKSSIRRLEAVQETFRQIRLQHTKYAKELKETLKKNALEEAEAMLEKALSELRYRGMDKADIQARLAAAIKGMSSTANMQKALQKEIDAIYNAEQNYDSKMQANETAVLAVFDKAGEPVTGEEARSLVKQYGLESVEEARKICTQRHAQREQAKAAALSGNRTEADVNTVNDARQFQPQIMPANKANDPMKRWRVGITFETNDLDRMIRELLALGGENPKWKEI